MKLSNNKTAAWMVAALASLGIAHADEGGVEIPTPTQLQLKLIRELLVQGVIVTMPTENWYQINHARLNEVMDQDRDGDQAARHTLELLKRICGEDTDIREVNIIVARLGTQDFAMIP